MTYDRNGKLHVLKNSHREHKLKMSFIEGQMTHDLGTRDNYEQKDPVAALPCGK